MQSARLWQIARRFWPLPALCVAIYLIRADFFAGAAVGLTLGIWGVWQLDRLRRRARELEERDPLTGTASRSAFREAVERGLSRCRATAAPITLAVLDCDSFKAVNDSFGHCVGDEVLRNVAEVLSQRLDGRGTVGRLWGDAFAVLLPAISYEDARGLLEEAQAALRARMSQCDWPVTFSIGAVTFDRVPEDSRGLLPTADAVMYSVKHGGRNGLSHRRVAGGRLSGDGASSASPERQSAFDDRTRSGSLPAGA
jgi:diguanylate cyclase (GGDEF)-like protein